jgi:hypothetical protein
MPNYPREIYLDEDTEARLISFLDTELLNHYGERATFVDDIIRYQTDYYAQPTTKQKKFPFVGAANIVIPTVITKKCSTMDCVPLANFLMPFTSQDPQFAPWVGEEHLKTPYEVLNMTESGFFREDTYEKLQSYYTYVQNTGVLSSAKYRETVQNLQNQTPVFPKQLGWVEIWLAFNVDGNTKQEQKEIVVHYHRQARLSMSCR